MPIAMLLIAGGMMAQEAPAPEQNMAPAERQRITIPAGTKVPLRLEAGISTKNAKQGDPVYARSTFPVTADDRIVIPAGTYLQGEITEIKRAGRVKGKAEVQVHFRTMIFPSGYTVSLPGVVEAAPDAESTHVKGKEGTIQQDSDTSKKVGTIAKTAGTGATIGAVADRSISGAAIGGGIGGAVGTAIGMLSRGTDVRLPQGTTLDMVFDRSVTIDSSRIGNSRDNVMPNDPPRMGRRQ